MDEISASVSNLYGNRLRVRACGICLENDRILLVNHSGLNPSNVFWSPPGGGCQWGETAPEALIREFAEETNLEITVKGLLFVNEFIQLPLHALELFFEVKVVTGEVTRGLDPEMGNNEGIIQEVSWVDFAELSKIPNDHKHPILARYSTAHALLKLRGYLKP